MGSDDSEVDKHDRVLAPDDLDITKRPEVEEIDDGRYVVSPNGPAKKPDKELLENPDWLDTDDSDDETEQSSRQPPAPRERRQPADSQQSDSQPSASQPNEGSRQPKQSQQPQGSRQPDQSQQPQGSRQSDQPQPAESNQPPQSPSKPSQSRTQPAGQSEPPQKNQSATQPSQRIRQSDRKRADKPTSRELAAHDQPPAEPPAVELTNENVSKFLAKSLAQTSSDYGFDATVNIEGNVNRGRMTSDDIGETLETLLRWYARQTTDEVEPEHVLGIILAGSELAVEYPVQSAYEVVKQHGLGPDDTISDLLAAVRKEGSFTVPPSEE